MNVQRNVTHRIEGAESFHNIFQLNFHNRCVRRVNVGDETPEKNGILKSWVI